jgi:tRNA-Thr(GGU) m(6)t(6)A37 methyltransferase TsaA
MDDTTFRLHPIGVVASPLVDRAGAPKQGDEGAPPSRILLDPAVRDAARDLQPGQEAVVLTWLHQAVRDVLAVHPRGDTTRPLTGVFSTRSPDRPNPIGLHTVTIDAIDGDVLSVRNLEAIDGTPVLDIKPVLGPVSDRCHDRR